MKNLLLTLASAALFAVPSMAQLNVTPLIQGNNIPVKKTNVVFGTNKALNQWNVVSLNRQSRVSEEVRPHKLLSYATTMQELTNLGLGSLPVTYNELVSQGFNGYGFAHVYAGDMLSRYIGNTIKSINFHASLGNYSKGVVFIMKMADASILWQAEVADLKPIYADAQGNLQVPDNTVECNYTITGTEGPLMIGWTADYTPANDVPNPVFKTNFVMPMYIDGTGSGMGAYMLARNAQGQMAIVNQFAGWQMQDGSQTVQAASLSIMTDGENGLKDNDVMVGLASNIRVEKSTGAGANSKVIFANMGLDPVKSIEYTFDADGATKTGKYDFKTPVKFYQTAQVNLEAAYPETPGRKDATFTVTKVNGVNDENMDNEDNEAKYEALVFEKGYRRVPVVENVTSSQCAWCPVVGPAMQKIARQTNGNFIPLNVHINMGPQATDPLVTNDNYMAVVGSMLGEQFNVPTSIVNRETAGNPYMEAPVAVQNIAASVCEANMKVSASKLPNPMVKDIKTTTTLDFTFDAPAGAYVLQYVVTEDGINSVPQVNGYATNFYQIKKQNPGVTDAMIYQAFAEQLGYDFVHDKELQKLCTLGKPNAQGIYFYNPTYTDVACTSTNLEEAKYIVPALKAGEKFTFEASLPAPVRTNPKVDRSKLAVTVLLIDKKSGVIVTATRAKLGEESVESAIESVEGDANVQIEAANGAFQVVAENAVAEVYSVDGKLVSSATVNGSASLPTFGKGVFIIRVTEGGNVVSKKAVF